MSTGNTSLTTAPVSAGIRLNAGRYEFWLYRQIRKRFLSGEIYLNDSLRHHHLSDELVAEGEQSAVLAEMKIPFLQKSIKTQLKALSGELHRQWKAFNRRVGSLAAAACHGLKLPL